MDDYEKGPVLVFSRPNSYVIAYEYDDGWGIVIDRHAWWVFDEEEDEDEDGEPYWLGWWFVMFFGYGDGPSLRVETLVDSLYLPKELSGVLGPYDTEAEALAAGVAFHRRVASDHALWYRYLNEEAENMRRWR
jgi:hypothetical protein